MGFNYLYIDIYSPSNIRNINLLFTLIMKLTKKAILNPIDEITFKAIMYKNNFLNQEDFCKSVQEIFQYYNIKNKKH